MFSIIGKLSKNFSSVSYLKKEQNAINISASHVEVRGENILLQGKTFEVELVGPTNVPCLLFCSTSWFLISSRPFRNGSVFAYRNGSSIATIRVKLSEHGSVPFLAIVVQHSSTLLWNDFGLTSPDNQQRNAYVTKTHSQNGY